MFEFAHEYLPDSGGSRTFVGNSHGNETQLSFVVAVDGSPVSLADGSTATGSTITVTRTSQLTHPDAETIADVELTYTLDVDGLTINHETIWLASGTVGAAYPAMLPVSDILDVGCTSGLTVSPQGLRADNDTSVCAAEASTAWLWDADGAYALMMASNDVQAATNDWALSNDRDLWIQDRSGGTINKAYLTRVKSGLTEAVGSGDVWTSSTTYRAAKFTSAHTTLGTA